MKHALASVAAILALTGCSPAGTSAQTQSQPPAPARSTVAPPPYTHAELAERGVKRFTFSDWQGPALTVWYLRTPETPADAPVLFVFHGVQRDADRYIGQWIDLAAREKLVVVVPEFDRKSFPGAPFYNHGNVIDAKGAAVPVPLRTFSVLEPLFDAVRQREGLTRPTYWLFGHSAGAQFVHRFVMTGNARRMERAVSANAGSYMMPEARFNWPFGPTGLPGGVWTPTAAYAAPMTVLLGTADNDPNYPSLPRDPEAMLQGPHRLDRGLNFYAAAKADAAARGVPFNWTCALAPGIAHDNGGMAPFGIAVFRQQAVVPCPESRR